MRAAYVLRMELELRAQIGAASRAARRRLGLTQAEVAERIGIVPEVYGRLERGRMLPSVVTLVRLCRALSVSADEMLGLAGEPALAPGPQPSGGPAPDVRRLLRRAGALDPRAARAIGAVVELLVRQSKAKRR